MAEEIEISVTSDNSWLFEIARETGGRRTVSMRCRTEMASPVMGVSKSPTAELASGKTLSDLDYASEHVKM